MNFYPESSDLAIKKLSLMEHKKILSEMDKFWLSQSKIMLPQHHALFSFLFTDFSFVLYNKTQIVSYIYATHNSTKGFIHIIATRAGHYRKGYASILLNHLEIIAMQKNLKTIWSYVLPGNNLSNNFFVKSQFIMQKEISISSDERRILFKKNL